MGGGGPSKWLQYYIGVITVCHESWGITSGLSFPQKKNSGSVGSLGTPKSDYVICARPLNGKNSRSSIAHAGSLISHIFCKRMKPFFTNSLFNMIESETKVLKLISILDVIQVRSRNFRLVNTEVRCEWLARLRTSQSLLFWSSVLNFQECETLQMY